MPLPKRLSGYTIVELMIASAIAGIIGVVVVFIVISGSRAFRGVNERQQETADVGRAILAEIYKPIRVAHQFLETTEINGVTYTASPNNGNQSVSTIILEMPMIIDAQGRPGCDLTKTDIIVFTQVGTAIHKITKAHPESARDDGDQILLENATIKFTQTKSAGGTNRKVKVEVTTPNKTYTEEMVARND